MPIPRELLLRVEFDWLAVDRCGHLAVVSTAGAGPIPAEVLKVGTERELTDPQSVIEALPILGNARAEGRGPGECTEWIEAGRRGVFVYDWRLNGGPYERIIVPEAPLVASLLESEARVAVVNTCFAEAQIINLPRA